MMTIKQIPVLALTALLLAGCGAQDAPAPATSPEAGVAAAKAADATAAGPFQASGATIRKPPGGRDVTAGFITITNPGAPDRLIAASTPVAASVELHTHTMADGMMQMRKVDGFDLPAGGTLNLASGGDHLMLFGVKSDLGADGPVPVTLTFQNAGAVEVMFAVGQEAGATD
nr:copper chaperone PCu(A)C [Hyphomonadaceae bacterium]